MYLTIAPSIVVGENMLIDNFSKKPQNNWQFFTDQVMGGVSEGNANIISDGNENYVRLEGSVSTANNGGFIQIRAKLIPEINSKDYNGVYAKVYGNEKNYSIH